jgi:putative RecB family exonuclease
MKDFISATQIKMFLRCSLQYRYRYLDGLKIPPVGAIILGRSIHKGLEVNYSQKKETKTDLPISRVVEIYSDSFDRAGKEEEVNWEGENPGRIKDSGVGLIEAYQNDIAPAVQPLSVEEEFNLEFQNVSYVLKGYLDLVDQNKVIRETKTANRSYSADSAMTDIQLTAYNLAWKYLKGEDPVSLCFDVLVKTKKPKVQTVVSTCRTNEQLNRFLKLLGNIAKAIQSGIFYPCENQQVCRWCGYAELCRKF